MRTSEQTRGSEINVHGSADTSASELTPLLTKQQVANWLSVSLRTVDAMIASGELRPFRVRGVRRFASSDVRSYLEASVADL